MDQRGAAHDAQWQPQSSGKAALAGLPLLLIGGGIASVSTLLRFLGGISESVHILPALLPHRFALVAGAVLLAGLCSTAVLALTSRLPRWAYSWVMLGLVGLVVALHLAAEGQDTVYSQAADVVVLALLALATLAHLGAAFVRGWQYAGLLSLSFTGLLGLSLCFWASAGPMRYDLGLLSAPIGLVLFTLAYWYIRGTNATRVAALAGTGLVGTWLSWTVNRAFHTWDPFTGKPSLLPPMLALTLLPLHRASVAILLGVTAAMLP